MNEQNFNMPCLNLLGVKIDQDLLKKSLSHPNGKVLIIHMSMLKELAEVATFKIRTSNTEPYSGVPCR